ncbi:MULTISPECIES: TonB-system energizer ExbB [Hydrogenophaga]|mgnify:CR=1 FL=1|uniref:TonB-system energizer ExbB n=1 Tax=Hydrogenophaga TaxID=47420 RepID=UPI0008ACEDE3|nr:MULTISPECIES: TonB-system energizer ExbB [Hydrogenophaga]MBU4180206.1 TonB-system energizer ExbB [Gammaproteobacteria bacterium]OGA75895.1 MAG: TonB-system energizer ExbB [Burkholderiales bacterium GWE1_65_30]OGA90124.1 MAG: TonB-system energizer ExbB [Burkholderiales bacterium GWF1_66_17]OGB22586.1 MAG: TonB-system energizer ExbB [Burkholderiales bacterium RIFCSPHIGHO2_02_FULL_66_10]MBU4283342.1 TonB-system energizer ExbB [Gammaproteobacteria bacterium]
MQGLRPLVEYAVFGILLLLSVAVVAIALERQRFFSRIDARGYTSRARLESDLTRRLNVIGTVASNAPYLGLLGTVLGIMLTFQTLGATGEMDVKSIMTGLALALKATAAGIVVAIPCVALNNALRRRVRERLTDFDEAHGG